MADSSVFRKKARMMQAIMRSKLPSRYKAMFMKRLLVTPVRSFGRVSRHSGRPSTPSVTVTLTEEQKKINRAKSSGKSITDYEYNKLPDWSRTKTNLKGDVFFERTVTGTKIVYKPDGNVDRVNVSYTEKKQIFGKNRPKDQAGRVQYSGEFVPTGIIADTGDVYKGESKAREKIPEVRGGPSFPSITFEPAKVTTPFKPTRKAPTYQPTPIGQMTAIPSKQTMARYDPTKTGKFKPKHDPFKDWKVGEESPYLTAYGYMPKDTDYLTAITGIEKQETLLTGHISSLSINIPQAKENIEALSKSITTIQARKGVETWTLDGIEYTREEALKKLGEAFDTNLAIVRQEKDIFIFEQQLIKLGETKKTLEEYREKGYTLDIEKEEGEITGYSFGLPTASKVHKKVFTGTVWGVEKSRIMMGATAFKESPFGIGSLASVVTSAVTGDPKATEEKAEEIAMKSLITHWRKEKYGVEEYIGSTLASPALITGVYIPCVTMGVGYAMTGVSIGAKGVIGAKATLLGKFGATPIGKVTAFSGKVGMITLGGVGIATTGITIATVAEDKPHKIPEVLAETAFTFGMAIGAFKYGGEVYKTRMPKIVTQDITATGMEAKTYPLKKGKIGFEIWGKEIIGKKPVSIFIKGVGEKVEGLKGYRISTGKGYMKYTVKSWGKRVLGLGKEKTIIRKIGVEADTQMVVKSPIETIYYSVGKGKFIAGKKGSYGYGYYEPVAGKAWVYMKPLGKLKTGKWIKPPIDRAEFLPTKKGITEQVFLQEGKYFGMFQKGKVTITGRIYSLMKTPKGEEVVVPKVHKFGVSDVTTGVKGKIYYFAKQKLIYEPEGLEGLKASLGSLYKESVILAHEATAITEPTMGKMFYTTAGAVSLAGLDIKIKRKPKTVMKPSLMFKLGRVIEPTTISLVKPISARKRALKVETVSTTKLGLITEKELPLITLGGLDVITDTKEEEDVVSIYDPLYDVAQAQAQKQKMGLLQKTQLKTMQKTVFEQVTTPVMPITPIVITPIPIVMGFPSGEKIDLAIKKRRYKRKRRPTKEKSYLVKTVLADPMSVMHSQALFGKATHPLPTKKIWSMAERKGWKLKTVELLALEKEKKKKPKKEKFDFTLGKRLKKKTKKKKGGGRKK